MDVNGEMPGMKRSTSEWDLDAFFPPQSSTTTSPSDAAGCGLRDEFLLRPGSDDLGFNFTGSRDVNTMSCYLIGDQTKGTLIRPQNHTPRQPSISATIESQSSLCAGTPTSSNKPKSGDNLGPGATSGSDQSDEESMEIEGGLCEQSMDVLDLKRMRRMVSNRESARRSRRRKQAQLQDLELQVDQLRGENASLCKRLTDAGQQFNDAATDNRVLKSNVEALRIKVKMAEDLVARGSLACTLNHLLQSPSVASHLLSTHQMYGSVDLPLPVDTQGDEARYVGMDVNNQLHTAGMENSDHSSVSHGSKPSHNQSLERISSLDYLHNRISSELSTCGSDIWPWDSHIIPVSK